MIKLRDTNGNVIAAIQDNGEMKFDDSTIKKEFEKAEEETNKQ